MAEQQEQETRPQYPPEPPPLARPRLPQPPGRDVDPARAKGLGVVVLVIGVLAAATGVAVQAALRGIRVSAEGLANMGSLVVAAPMWLLALVGMCAAIAAVAALALRPVPHRMADIGFVLWLLALALHGHAVFAYAPLLGALRGQG